jgi:hypothetical protein
LDSDIPEKDQPMPQFARSDRPARPSRILFDVAEGRLDEVELEAVAAWLAATAAEPPAELLERGMGVGRRLLATV